MRLALPGTRSVRVSDRARLEALCGVEAVVVVGASCTGKTTLVEAVRSSDLVRSGVVSVPRRFVTRARRGGDCLEENVHVSREEFEAGVRAGRIALAWDRTLDAETLRYGFEVAGPGLPVYSANNAVLGGSVQPPRALERALIVGVYAPDEVRAERLRARSPDLWRGRPGEARCRLAESGASVVPSVHLVIENHGELEAVAPRELVSVVEAVLALARDDAIS